MSALVREAGAIEKFHRSVGAHPCVRPRGQQTQLYLQKKSWNSKLFLRFLNSHLIKMFYLWIMWTKFIGFI